MNRNPRRDVLLFERTVRFPETDFKGEGKWLRIYKKKSGGERMAALFDNGSHNGVKFRDFKLHFQFFVFFHLSCYRFSLFVGKFFWKSVFSQGKKADSFVFSSCFYHFLSLFYIMCIWINIVLKWEKLRVDKFARF